LKMEESNIISAEQARSLIKSITEKRMVLKMPSDTIDEMVDYLTGIKPEGAVTVLPEYAFFVPECPNGTGDRMQHISLRRLINNQEAGLVMPTFRQNVKDYLTTFFGAYSSDLYMRLLFSDENMVRILNGCLEPFSMLGKIENVDVSTGVTKAKTSPLLVIPGRDIFASAGERSYSPAFLERLNSRI